MNPTNKIIVHKGYFGKTLCEKAKIGEYITHNIYVKITCNDCLK